MSIYFSDNTQEINKLSLVTSPGLSSAEDSIDYRIAEIETHFHNRTYCYGNTSNTFDNTAVAAFSVTGGSGAWGTEIEVHNGTVIQSGSTTKKFDIHSINVATVGTANRNTCVQLYYGTRGTAVAATTQIVGDTITKVTHGLTNGTKIALDSIVSTTGINNYTTYYVISAAADTFQISLTLGGAAVDLLTSDGTCTYAVLTQTLLTEKYITSSVNTTQPYAEARLICPRVTCNNRVWVRAKSSGGTNALGLLFELHIYNA